MPRRRKGYREDAINDEDITSSLKNTRQSVANWLDQLATEKLSAPVRARWTKKSTHTLIEFTKAVVEPLKDSVDQGFILPQELILALLSGALFIQCTYIDKPRKRDIDDNTLVENMYE